MFHPLFFVLCFSSPKVPVCGVSSHEKKVLAVTWARSDSIISGGEDGNLIVHGFQSAQ